MSIAIKQIVKTEGWNEILKMFNKEIENNLDTRNIKETMSAEHIKLEVMSRNKASKIVNRVLKKIQKIVNTEPLKDKVSYR